MVPRFFGLRPELNLALIEGISGEPKISRLIKQRVLGRDPEPGVTLEAAIEACGRIVSTLHGASLEVDVVRELSGEVDALGKEIGSVQEVAPELAEALRGCLERVEEFHSTEEPLAPRPCHGDFTHSQVVFDDEGGSGLLDFDTMCLAEPALDLGCFGAYLRVACRKAEIAASQEPGLGDELCELFLDTYLDAPGNRAVDHGQLRARMDAFETLVLVRMTLRSWHQLKPARVSNIFSVLRERLECLSASGR
jgi:aminoglycoside phosphotransferase (APT) family kinase protein